MHKPYKESSGEQLKLTHFQIHDGSILSLGNQHSRYVFFLAFYG